METFDLIVIGAGPGGYPAAIRAAQLGKKVAIIEREHVGGTCLNVGCIPTKTLISSAERYQQVKNAKDMGVTVEKVKRDYKAMAQRKNDVVATLSGGVSQLLEANGVTLYNGTASFESSKQLAVENDEGTQHIKAEKIIIATGSTSTMPGFIPKHKRIVDSRAFLDLKTLPKKLIVLGGGYIGCELACMAAMLGVKVTIVELLEDILLLLDKDVRSVVSDHMTKELGIEVMTGTPMEKIKADAKSASGKVGKQTVSADMLLVSVGRSPVTDGLSLDRAGLETNERGFIDVDKYNRTAVSSIYAIGDVNGIMMLAHAATSQAIIAAEHACGSKPGANETLIPGVIFTAPEVALVGLTETEAREKEINIATGKYHFRGLGKALAANETEGFVKWIADADTDQLLGAQAVGAHATDLISEACLAIRAELTAEELGNTVHAHPTFAEIWMEAAHALHGRAIHAPPKRR